MRRYSKESVLGVRLIYVAILLAVEFTCQGHAAELLKPLGNQTVVLGAEAHFSCLLVGREEDLRLRIDGRLTALPFITPDLVIRVESSPRVDGLSISNVSIDITATRERNLTRIECYDVAMDSADFSVASLTVRGGPGKPEVKYEVKRDKGEIVLSWQRPFTWEDYPITGYVIECRDGHGIINYIINDTDITSRSFVNHTVELPRYVPECYSLYCYVTAYNALDSSIPSISNSAFPSLVKADLGSRVLVVKQTRLQDNEYEIFICVELPVLCDFQSVDYSVVFSHGGDTVLELYRGFNYSSGYSSECIEEVVDRELVEGVEYSVQVVVDAGGSGNSSSLLHTFTLTPSSGSDCEGKEKGFRTCLLEAGASAALSLLVFLPVGMLLGCCGLRCCMKRDKEHSTPRRRSQRGEESHYDEPLPVTHNMAYASSKQRSS